ncbi:chromosomal replication initiator protein DnaA [Thermosulfurimonas marina]|uniref:Chromosomal replication initiator protein DnaA n=1 Tax=Thermosulfurimonas marina TaxID=2047767 RepID=A0A6H1WTM1_9BACT|nr:chromosomal replication initiator protein DnaA [Thermosulfurimonas marina]QJA06542.1 chromosomal replication initiator protein DnaA [Thermosulfurimonas marina]
MPSLSEKIKDYLRERLPESAFRVWIRPLRLEEEGSRVRLVFPNTFSKEWVEENYGRLLAEALECLAPEKEAEWVVEEETPAPVQLALPYEPARVLGRRLSPRFTFEEFVVGDCNRLAYRVCRRVVEDPRGQIVYLTAESGLGKSHLSQALGHALLKEKEGLRLCYLTARDFTTRLMQALRGGQMEEFKERLWRGCDVLVLDEIHQIPPRDFTQGELALALDHLYEEEKAVVFTSLRRPHELSHLDSSLRSRLSAGVIVRINPPDYETRKNIIRRKAARQGYRLPEEVVEFLARRLRGDIRRIESAVVGLIARASLLREPVTLQLARELVAEIAPPEGPDRTEIIIQAVCRAFHIDPEELRSSSRKKRISEPRQVAMFFLRKFTSKSLAAIGERFNRDHATVVYALQAVERKLVSSDRFRYRLEYLEKELRESLRLEEDLEDRPEGPEETPGAALSGR